MRKKPKIFFTYWSFPNPPPNWDIVKLSNDWILGVWKGKAGLYNAPASQVKAYHMHYYPMKAGKKTAELVMTTKTKERVCINCKTAAPDWVLQSEKDFSLLPWKRGESIPNVAE